MRTRRRVTSTSFAAGGDRIAARELLIVLALVLLPVGRVVATYHVFSETSDEPIHVAAGFDWWTNSRYDFELEHPPLARMFFAVQPYVTGATLKYDADRAVTGNSILYRDDRYHTNLAWVRAGNLPFLAIALLSVWLLARLLFGTATALFALALFGAVPSVLAHGGLATTDMAATAFVTAAAAAFAYWLEQPTWRSTAALSFSFAFGLIAKFSFIPFFAIAAASMLVLRRSSGWTTRAKQLLVVLAVGFGVVAAAYHFRVATINEVRIAAFPPGWAASVAARYARVPGYWWVREDIVDRFWAYSRDVEKRGIHDADFVDWAKAAGYPSPLAGRHGNTMSGAPPPQSPSLAVRLVEPLRSARQWFATHVPIVAPQYVVGAEVVEWHNRMGHPAYLFGQHSQRGWWYYFPVVFFFKTPVAFLVLAAIGVVILIRRAGLCAAVAFAPLLMFVPAMASHINIGVRHILPVYAFLAIAAAAGAKVLPRIASIALLAWFFIAGAVAHPDYLPYFNEVAGAHPEHIALDSNFDWGQDLLRLKSIVSRRNITHLHVSYFGSADWRRHLPGADELPRRIPVDGWIAISEMNLASGDFEWLRKYNPVQRAGPSIRLYDIRFQ